MYLLLLKRKLYKSSPAAVFSPRSCASVSWEDYFDGHSDKAHSSASALALIYREPLMFNRRHSAAQLRTCRCREERVE